MAIPLWSLPKKTQQLILMQFAIETAYREMLKDCDPIRVSVRRSDG